MSSRRKPYALKGGSRLIPQGVISDFPIPRCEDCEEQMVKLEGRWGCKDCTLLDRLIPVAKPDEDGNHAIEFVNTKIPLGAVYPNREARRRIR